jgi:hypothetical protein
MQRYTTHNNVCNDEEQNKLFINYCGAIEEEQKETKNSLKIQIQKYLKIKLVKILDKKICLTLYSFKIAILLDNLYFVFQFIMIVLLFFFKSYLLYLLHLVYY